MVPERDPEISQVPPGQDDTSPLCIPMERLHLLEKRNTVEKHARLPGETIPVVTALTSQPH